MAKNRSKDDGGASRREFERQKPADRLGDAPVQDEYHLQMRAIMETLDEFMNPGKKGPDKKTGIVLLMFPFGEAEGGRVNYMSNGADRKDVLVLMKEMVARFEGQPEVTGRA